MAIILSPLNIYAEDGVDVTIVTQTEPIDSLVVETTDEPINSEEYDDEQVMLESSEQEIVVPEDPVSDIANTEAIITTEEVNVPASVEDDIKIVEDESNESDDIVVSTTEEIVVTEEIDTASNESAQPTATEDVSTEMLPMVTDIAPINPTIVIGNYNSTTDLEAHKRIILPNQAISDFIQSILG